MGNFCRYIITGVSMVGDNCKNLSLTDSYLTLSVSIYCYI